jgi:hypothetical protein
MFFCSFNYLVVSIRYYVLYLFTNSYKLANLAIMFIDGKCTC